MKYFALLVALASATSFAGSKDRDWQKGKLLDTNFNPYFDVSAPGSPGHFIQDAPAPYSINQSDSTATYDAYVIEAGGDVYLVQRSRVRSAPAARVRTYGSVKIAVEKNKLWLVDEDGKEYQTKILGQKRKP